ncbi:hypothetical protein PgNI_10939 [Pyricularia grisea]|uniref:Glycosyl transferase family 25 domain-containing protein n=1 Tax=Pyricularia grisea TaxID=148305 RepID=A0A6P8AYS3_PYRGI|nr:hypothetical protein PgNI_10939 [Pyricularia grisea]TLD07492.1 hypothetical protein PgNI_10939 [Pyricularia grisea]
MLSEKGPSLLLQGGRRTIGLLLIAAAFFFLLLTYISIPSYPRLPPATLTTSSTQSRPNPARPIPEAPKPHTVSVYEAASNGTVGLDSLIFLNLPHRHDRFDAVAIQAHLSKLKITRFPAVDASQLKNSGMPPAEGNYVLKEGEKGCFRAHANVWQHMLENDIAATLVFESDAGWDINFRQIMGKLNGGFRNLLQKEYPDNRELFQENPDDPWLARSGTWDILSLGHCVDQRTNGQYVVYDDPHAPNTDYKFGLEMGDVLLNHKRIVFRTNALFCTTGYLVSLSGAARMLVRMAWNFDVPVDVIMNQMINAGELRAYSMQQRPVVQWSYISGIGKGTSNSDIQSDGRPEEGNAEGWDRAKKDRSVYDYHGGYADASLVEFALNEAWHRIIGNN